MGEKTPQEDLDDFLAKQPPWLRKALRWEFPATPVEASAYGQYGMYRFLDLLQHYEALASRVPKEWREYRKRRKQAALPDLPSAKPGRPRLDAIVEEAKQLQLTGNSYAQIARELNRKHGAQTTTADAIRKLIKSRRPRPGPEKI